MYPIIFIGHGSPMNAIEENQFTKAWRELRLTLKKPKAILAISAHWETKGTKIQMNDNPNTIYDFYNFPKQLYQIEYKARGSNELSKRVSELIKDAQFDSSRGFDHGVWSVLHIMYPEADIPVVQISIDMSKTPQELYKIGKSLKPLRDEDVLIIASGNVVHNLQFLSFNIAGGYEWALKFDDFVYDKIKSREFDEVLNYQKQGDIAKLSVPEDSHILPLFYILGASDEKDEIKVFNRVNFAGSLSMTSYVFDSENNLV